MLNDKKRGPTLEAIVNRMKVIQKTTEIEQREDEAAGQAGSNFISKIRFIATSATINNIEDIAEWLATADGKPAIIKKFGEEYRPVKLNKMIVGYPSANSCGAYKFDVNLNYKLSSIIQQYSNNKPTLVFCTTRKGLKPTATVLAKSMSFRFSGKLTP